MAIDVTSNARELAQELGRTSIRTTRRIAQAVEEQGQQLSDAWADNARGRYGDGHGKLHPDRIKSHNSGPLTRDVYPDLIEVGEMYEFGGANQPAHLDGQRALDARQEWIYRALNIAALDD